MRWYEGLEKGIENFFNRKHEVEEAGAKERLRRLQEKLHQEAIKEKERENELINTIGNITPYETVEDVVNTGYVPTNPQDNLVEATPTEETVLRTIPKKTSDYLTEVGIALTQRGFNKEAIQAMKEARAEKEKEKQMKFDTLKFTIQNALSSKDQSLADIANKMIENDSDLSGIFPSGTKISVDGSVEVPIDVTKNNPFTIAGKPVPYGRWMVVHRHDGQGNLVPVSIKEMKQQGMMVGGEDWMPMKLIPPAKAPSEPRRAKGDTVSKSAILTPEKYSNIHARALRIASKEAESEFGKLFNSYGIWTAKKPQEEVQRWIQNRVDDLMNKWGVNESAKVPQQVNKITTQKPQQNKVKKQPKTFEEAFTAFQEENPTVPTHILKKRVKELFPNLK